MTMVVVLAGLPFGVGVTLLEMIRVVVSGVVVEWDLMKMLAEGETSRGAMVFVR